MTKLEQLDLKHSLISDLSPNGLNPWLGLTNLEIVDLQYNLITDISPFAGMVMDPRNYFRPFLSYNPIVDLAPLLFINGLYQVSLYGVTVTPEGSEVVFKLRSSGVRVIGWPYP